MVTAGLTQCHAVNWPGMQDLGLIPGQDVEKSLLAALNHVKVPIWIAAEAAATSHSVADFQLVILKGPTQCLEL